MVKINSGQLKKLIQDFSIDGKIYNEVTIIEKDFRFKECKLIKLDFKKWTPVFKMIYHPCPKCKEIDGNMNKIHFIKDNQLIKIIECKECNHVFKEEVVFDEV